MTDKQEPENPMTADLLWKFASAPGSVVVALLLGWELMIAQPERTKVQVVALTEQRHEFILALASTEERSAQRIQVMEDYCTAGIYHNTRLLEELLRRREKGASDAEGKSPWNGD